MEEEKEQNESQDFPKRLKRLRMNLGLTPKDVAKQLGVSVTAYRNWELGNRTPKVSTVEKLASILDSSTGYLLLGGKLRKESEFSDILASESEEINEEALIERENLEKEMFEVVAEQTNDPISLAFSNYSSIIRNQDISNETFEINESLSDFITLLGNLYLDNVEGSCKTKPDDLQKLYGTMIDLMYRIKSMVECEQI